MKKFTLLAATALVSLTAAAQVSVGLERPKNSDGGYEAFASTEAYLKQAEDLSVSFYESEFAASKRETNNEYGLIYHGDSKQSDFAWGFECTGEWGATDHPADGKFPEGFAFGFGLEVPQGKQLAVNDVTLDLLFNANPTWRVRIVDANGTELYNSGNFDKYGALRGYLSCGGYAKITADALSLEYVADPNAGLNADNAETKAGEALTAGFQLLPAGLTLAAGSYTVALDFDFGATGTKRVSFDSFTVTGTLSEDGQDEATTVTYAIQVGDTFTSGQTVSVKDGDDVVAAITYGEAGGNDFTAAKANKAIDGFVAFTEGNGTNGNSAGGTFYTIVPAKDGVVTVGVVLNAGKKFYVEEDGTALNDFNGITVDEKLYGTFTFPVQAGKSYKVYCAGSKLGFYGFKYTYDVATGIETVGTPKAETNAMYNLRGQCIDAPQQGQIYIMNGHKYIAR